MAVRLASAVAGIIVLLAVVLADNILIFNIALVICALIGMWELFKTFGLAKKPLVTACAALLTALILLPGYFDTSIIFAAFFVYALILACHMLYYYGEFKFAEMATAVFCIIYLPVPLLSLLMIRGQEQGFFLLWIALGGAWVTDSFAYFSGRLFGKHKLCPSVSPKKTVEGSVGGSICTVVVGMLYGFFVGRYGGAEVNYIALAAVSLVCAAVSQIGDLTASVIKREKGIKDFGNIMPGHGGFIDRFDSMLFVAPAVYLFNSIFTIFG